ncbi:MAG: N-6 DNA methylase [Dehalococcoidia bacterium]|nr:N-6 DNA methylase [Dehalococcoidia bacterium]
MAEALQLEELIRRESPRIAKAISQAAAKAGNEAEFRRPVANLIEEFAEPLDVSFRVQEERTLIAGRADAVYNRFVIEYEPPRSLHGSNGYRNNQHAIDQVRQYIDELHRIERHRVERMAGVATDGSWYIFARYKEGAWTVDEPLPVTPESTATFLRYLASLSTEVALTADHLVRDFGENTTVSRLCVSTIYGALVATDHPKVKVIYDQWREQFAEVCGYDEGRSRVDLRRLARNYGIKDASPNAFRLFFSIHTYYATFIKLLALQVAHFYLAPKLGTGLRQVASYSTDQLLDYLRKMERGGIFRELGINNFLEGDFFGWYLDVWDEAIDKAVRRIVSELAHYSLVTLDVDPEQTRDLLKKLYQNVMPKQVRHNLGQYYTPDWLAERLLNQLGYQGDPDKRLLDPACGSGTFLVLAIQRVKKTALEKMLPEADVLQKILANIVGFDLDPLAVMSARTNYLLAIGDLLQHRQSEVNIPVYLADSILTPAQMEELVGQQMRMMGPEERQYRFKTVVGQFAIPGSLVTAQYVDQLARLLEESVELKRTPEDFRRRFLAIFPLVEGRDKQDLDVVQDLYQRLRQLDEAGVNGIWARIIKNAFAPLFVGRFHYVAGNPPWVVWANLPSSYRSDTGWLWEGYGLTAKASRPQFELGKQSRDISMLFTYVCLDGYVDTGGRLGFVITQSVFKTQGGECFRRFSIANRPFKVRHVDDMVRLQPFEGASNRTSVVIIEKAAATTYPVPYTLWRKRLKGTSIPQEATLDAVSEMTMRSNFVAMPVASDEATAPWITGRPQALRAATRVIGRAAYEGHVGVHTVGGNGVYWLNIVARRPDGLLVVSNVNEGAKRKAEAVQASVEPDLVYPLLRGRDVRAWYGVPSLHMLVPHSTETGWQAINEAALDSEFPRAYGYLKRFQNHLLERAPYKLLRKGHPFYILFGISDYTFAPYKVVWREQGSKLSAAVVGLFDGKPVIPDHKLMLVPLDSEAEAHYVCAMLNSSPCQFVVASYVVEVQTSTHILEHVRIPAFDPHDDVHRRLAELSKQAHEETAAGTRDQSGSIEAQIDAVAARLWGLSDPELREIQQSLAELTG